MNRDHIENEIEQLLSDFSAQFARAKNYKAIPQIELDLMTATIRNLYEQLYKLNAAKSVETAKAVESIKTIEIEKRVEPEKVIAVAPKMVEEEKEIVTPVVQQISSEAKPEIAIPEIVVEEKVEVVQETIVHHHHQQEEVQIATSIKRESVFQEQTKVQTNSIASLFDDVPTIAGNYKEQQSLHHKIGNTKTERLSDKLHQQPVVDLKRSIGINEKFAFMNELFKGNQQQYNYSIDTLNNFRNYEEAQAHLATLASGLKWNLTSVAYQELEELVQRRFGV